MEISQAIFPHINIFTAFLVEATIIDFCPIVFYSMASLLNKFRIDHDSVEIIPDIGKTAKKER